MDSCFVRVDGVEIHYWKAGSGPPLVMVHGLVADGRNWELNVPALVGLRTVYALDMPNMGRSARVRGAAAGLATTAEWLGRLLDALGLERADLVGSSHGGAVCLMFAAARPLRVRSLALFAPANPFCRRPRPIIRFWTSPLGKMAAWMIPRMPRVVTDFAHRQVYGDPSKARESTLAGYREGLNPQSIAHLQRIVATWWDDMAELERALPQVAQVPVLLVWGSRDGVVGLDSGQRLRRVLGAELQVLPGAGHLPFIEEAEAANAALIRWLTRGRRIHDPVT